MTLATESKASHYQHHHSLFNNKFLHNAPTMSTTYTNMSEEDPIRSDIGLLRGGGVLVKALSEW